MKTERSLSEDIVPDCNIDTLLKPLHDEGVAELHGSEFKAPLTRPAGNSNSDQVEDEYLKQLVYLLIWKEMERELLDEQSGAIPQFERQLDSFAKSFDRVFTY